MSRWTYEELRELVNLWPTSSASEIAKRLHRLRSAVRSKAMQLREDGLLPRTLPKHFDVNPPKRPWPRSRSMVKPPPPAVDDGLAMEPRSASDIVNQGTNPLRQS